MTTTTAFRAHFDGKVIVPDEVVDLPVNQPIELQLRPTESPDAATQKVIIEDRLQRLAQATGHIDSPPVDHSLLRREHLYNDDGR